MDITQKISERQWNLKDTGQRESEREQTFIDDIVQKNHLEREVLSSLDRIKTVFDGGAGCGRFSILLAKRGIHVTHFDISQTMIDKARELAQEAGVLDSITFVKGALEDLSAYHDKQFDMSISFDAPISYTHPNQDRVIGELVRIAKKRIMVSVSSRLGSLPYLANPLNKNQFILDENCSDPWVQWCLSNRQNLIESFRFDKATAERALSSGLFGEEEAIEEYEKGGAPWPITYLFLPDELKAILERFGVRNVHMAGPGAYARTIPHEILQKIMLDPAQKADFLDFCYRYDKNQYVLGLGKDNLFARGDLE